MDGSFARQYVQHFSELRKPMENWNRLISVLISLPSIESTDRLMMQSLVIVQ